ncbi:MAG: mechanosensitive ion channel family protein [Phormidium sp. GEM2.Bin31]|nr:mechanosensitive ion channel [Phormidium sp. BM_Day4_Bin.17]TVR10715.1 MAG: mechanosensitive ion channel family protein [Phormidium sp. GEM2.Bin31]UCJ10851.1 MAG: mechanosensitive ion channel family protein [Phormidium sp. PBR-2020]
MTFSDILEPVEIVISWLVDANVLRLIIFLGFLLLSLLLGQFTPRLVRALIYRFFSDSAVNTYENLVEPVKQPLQVAGSLLLIYWSSVWLQTYEVLYAFLIPVLDFSVIVSVAWLASKVFRQIVRVYGIELLKKLGLEVDELLLVFETIANLLIGLFAVFAFAQTREFDLFALFAGLGIGGLAVAAASQRILEQFLSTVVLYLDRPFTSGDYIRLKDGELGRVESIGLRSTKIRTSAKSTLFIVPNSILVNIEVENLTRAKKVMSMIYLDFAKALDEQDMALVREVVTESTNSVFGIDPGSTSLSFSQDDEGLTTQARVTFFILGSNENSIELRKRLLELANQTISGKLSQFGITFSSQEPTVYVESPITL